VSSGVGRCAAYDPRIPSAVHFSKTIENPYFPLPVGRTFVYRGVDNGKKELDRMVVTHRAKKIAGITATVVSDNVYEPPPKLLEKTFDYYAQDDKGNVWYLGEDTKEFLGGGIVGTSGSWRACTKGAKPGLIMEADPQVPDAYRQECLSGEAEDLAWVVARAAPGTCCGRSSSRRSSRRSSSGRSTSRIWASSPSSSSRADTRPSRLYA
jgi:hypothetical protein